jgi:hypothetical protein
VTWGFPAGEREAPGCGVARELRSGPDLTGIGAGQRHQRPGKSQLNSAPGIEVSAEFTGTELRRIEAYAVLFGTSPDAVIREACAYFLSAKIGSQEYEAALADRRREHASPAPASAGEGQDDGDPAEQTATPQEEK